MWDLWELLKHLAGGRPIHKHVVGACFELLILVGVTFGLLRHRLHRLRSKFPPFYLHARRHVKDFRAERLSLFLRNHLSTTLLIIALCFSTGLAFFMLFLVSLDEPMPALGRLFLLVLFLALSWLSWKLLRLLRKANLGDRLASCPSPGRLNELLAERLPPQEQARLAAHLETCPACQHRLERLSAGHNSWLGMAHKLSERPPSPEPALRKVMAQLKESDEEATGDEPAFAGDLPLGFLSPSDKPGQLGRLERYDVLEEIGRGGMGVVLKAFDPSLHRVVAIKVLAPQLATSGVARKRFLREAKAAAAVTHDHIVTIHAVDEANGLPYLVMHYVAGMSLQDRIDKEGPLELAEILRIGMQTASGLAAAHGHGIVHRDIKPANILLEDGVQRVKITDFGLARAMDDASLTQSGFVAGSPLYMAPEQARGETLDHRADLFSLGSVLYTMCTGRPPFRAANTLAVLRRVSEDMPRPIRETNPEVPDWLAAVVDKLMAKEPAERYQSAAEVVEVLGQHLAQLQQAKWVPPPAAANAAPAGLPTSVTICPSCGASLHVPESMMGTLVHCAECGKPFHVEDTSEVMQVARPVRWPLGSRGRMRGKLRHWVTIAGGYASALLCRVWRKLPRLLWIAGGCASLLLLGVVFIAIIYESRSGPPAPAPLMGPNTRQEVLHSLPSGATLVGTLELTAFGSLTLGDTRAQSLLRLFVPKNIAAERTLEKLGRIQLDRVTLGYYDETLTRDARAIVYLTGMAPDGHKRITEFLRRNAGEKVQVEELNKKLTANDPVCISGPELPFALKIIDDNHAYLTASLGQDAKPSHHRDILRFVPPSMPMSSPVPNSFWGNVMSSNDRYMYGFFLGEIPTKWRKMLTESLQLRMCPHRFTLLVLRESYGLEGYRARLILRLELDEAGREGEVLCADLEKWRWRALGNLQALFPALRKEPRSLVQLGETLKGTYWRVSGPGCVEIQTHVDSSTWKAVGTLLKRMARPDEDD